MTISRTALSVKGGFVANRDKSKSLFSSINRYRASKKLSALIWDDTLYSYCLLHNIDMHSSRAKSSNFSMGYAYDENVAHMPGSSQKVLDLWKSRNKEKENMLCSAVKYSAISVYGDATGCYATQIFMEHRPKKNDKVVSMKTQSKYDTYKNGKKITAKGISGGSLKPKSIASTKLRNKNSLSLAKTGASGRAGSRSNPPLLKNAGNVGECIRNTIASGIKSLGEALDNVLPSSSVKPSRERPVPRTERKTGACRSLPLISSPNSLPYSFDVGPRSRPSVPRQAMRRSGYSRMNRRNESYESDSFDECSLCRQRWSRETEVCTVCSTYM